MKAFILLSLIGFLSPEASKLACHEFRDAVADLELDKVDKLLSENIKIEYGDSIHSKDLFVQAARPIDRVLIPDRFQKREPIMLESARCRKRRSLSEEEKLLQETGDYAFYRLISNGEDLQPKRDTLREITLIHSNEGWKVLSWSPSMKSKIEDSNASTNPYKD